MDSASALGSSHRTRGRASVAQGHIRVTKPPLGQAAFLSVRGRQGELAVDSQAHARGFNGRDHRFPSSVIIESGALMAAQLGRPEKASGGGLKELRPRGSQHPEFQAFLRQFTIETMTPLPMLRI